MDKNFPQSKDFELSLLLKPDPEFKDLREYMDQYIKQALKKFEMSQEVYDQLYWQLTQDIAVAARRYLQNDRSKNDYKFSTYYSRYLKDRLNGSIGLTKKAD